MADPRYTRVGKEVLLDGTHFADARDEISAVLITAGMNAIVADPETEEPWLPMDSAPQDGTEIEVKVQLGADADVEAVHAVWWLNLDCWRVALPNGEVGAPITPLEWRSL